MLRALAVAFALVATGAIASDVTTPAPAVDPYASPIEQCLRDNAGKVEASIADLNQAVDFLVGKVCAAPIAEHVAERAKLQVQQNVLHLQKLCDDQAAQAAAKSDGTKPETGHLVVNGVDYCAVLKSVSTTPMAPLPYDPWVPGLGVMNANPPAAVALASQLILNLRAGRKHRGD